MKWVKQDVELLSPCFCSGADQKKGEVRVPSIRGQLRWWCRTLGMSAQEESSIFGTVKGSASRSRLLVRLSQTVESARAVNLTDLKAGNPGNPVGYLLWPLRESLNSDARRGMLSEGTTFGLQLREVGSKTLTEDLSCGVHAWLLLGALGARSRRCAGSVWPQEGGLFDPPRSEDELRATLGGLLNDTSMRVHVMLLSRGSSEAMEAVAKADKWLHRWRAGSTKSIKNPNRWGRNDHDAGLGLSETVYRPAIGLPLMQRYSGERQFIANTSYGENNRWGSPIHLKVIRLGTRYFPMAVFMADHLIPEDTRLTIKGGPSARHQVSLSHDLFYEMAKAQDGERELFSSL